MTARETVGVARLLARRCFPHPDIAMHRAACVCVLAFAAAASLLWDRAHVDYLPGSSAGASCVRDFDYHGVLQSATRDLQVAVPGGRRLLDWLRAAPTLRSWMPELSMTLDRFDYRDGPWDPVDDACAEFMRVHYWPLLALPLAAVALKSPRTA
jgi:hypothetical protein